jgi:phosphoglycerol transferase MdoB-like AlkP superfamily enzyme
MLDNTSFSPYTNSTGFADGSLVPLLNPEQVQKVKSYAFWIKLIAILTFIGLVPLLIGGIILTIFIIGLPILAVGVFLVYLNLKLWKASQSLEAIVNNNYQQAFNLNALEFIMKIGSYYKITAILTILGIVLNILLFLLSIIFSSALDSYIQQVDKNVQSSLQQSK